MGHVQMGSCLLQRRRSSVLVGNVFGCRQDAIVLGQLGEILFEIRQRCDTDIRNCKENKSVRKSGNDRMYKTKTGDSDGLDEALERHGEDEVEGPPAWGCQGRPNLNGADRNEFAQVEPWQRSEAEVMGNEEDYSSSLDGPTELLWLSLTL